MTRAAYLRSTVLLFTFVTLVFPGCDSPSCGGCTTEFRSYTVRVVNSDGSPIEGMTATIRNERTGALIDPSPIGGEQGEGGFYTIITDSQLDSVPTDGDTLSFRATGGGLLAEASFVIGADHCRCHIWKISGPETITAH